MNVMSPEACANALMRFRRGEIDPDAWTELYLNSPELRRFVSAVIAREHEVERAYAQEMQRIGLKP